MHPTLADGVTAWHQSRGAKGGGLTSSTRHGCIQPRPEGRHRAESRHQQMAHRLGPQRGSLSGAPSEGGRSYRCGTSCTCDKADATPLIPWPRRGVAHCPCRARHQCCLHRVCWADLSERRARTTIVGCIQPRARCHRGLRPSGRRSDRPIRGCRMCGQLVRMSPCGRESWRVTSRRCWSRALRLWHSAAEEGRVPIQDR